MLLYRTLKPNTDLFYATDKCTGFLGCHHKDEQHTTWYFDKPGVIYKEAHCSHCKWRRRSEHLFQTVTGKDLKHELTAFAEQLERNPTALTLDERGEVPPGLYRNPSQENTVYLKRDDACLYLLFGNERRDLRWMYARDFYEWDYSCLSDFNLDLVPMSEAQFASAAGRQLKSTIEFTDRYPEIAGARLKALISKNLSDVSFFESADGILYFEFSPHDTSTDLYAQYRYVRGRWICLHESDDEDDDDGWICFEDSEGSLVDKSWVENKLGREFTSSLYGIRFRENFEFTEAFWYPFDWRGAARRATQAE